ncbi:LysR substrate-binding domain-containing protein [Pseudonocardia alni subsp. carboxydivorans]|uniref:LysR family transcriptional regulator n=1 Tax=Pseudonocardia alni subsp. carboxydivorans TaxID=415010 RepID=A0ABU9AJG8_PSEA5
MQIEWIHAFLAVVDRGGFTAAAVHLYRSQGRISSHIASLERELGAQLFDRDQRPARLTAAGEALVTHARAMVEELDAGRAAMASVQGLIRGDVTLATYPSAGAAFVPEVLRRFSEDFPGIRVELVEQAVRGIDRALDQGPALLAVRPTLPPPRSTHSLSHRLLWREPMCLVVPSGHRLADQETAALADLRGEQLVVSGHDLRYDTEAFRLLTRESIEPRIRFLSDQPQILVGLVRSGLALGFTNRLAIDSVRTDGVAVVGVSPRVYREVGVYWAPALAGSPAASALLETLLGTPVPDTTTDLR